MGRQDPKSRAGAKRHRGSCSVNYRNRRLLDLAHRVNECQNCGAFTPEGCEPAHSNLGEHGKGVSLKSHDVFFACLCHSCHAWLDQGSGSDPSGMYTSRRDEKAAMWRAAFDKTQVLLWSRGMVRVA